MRKTEATVKVAMELLEDPGGQHYGYDLSRRSGVRSGVLYPILTRMFDEGWLADGWQDADEARAIGKPARRYYRVTDLGMARLGAMLAEARADRRFQSLNWKPAYFRLLGRWPLWMS